MLLKQTLFVLGTVYLVSTAAAAVGPVHNTHTHTRFWGQRTLNSRHSNVVQLCACTFKRTGELKRACCVAAREKAKEKVNEM